MKRDRGEKSKKYLTFLSEACGGVKEDQQDSGPWVVLRTTHHHKSICFTIIAYVIFIFTGNAMYRTTKADFEIPSLRSCSSSLVFFFTERRRLSVPVRITTTHHCVHSKISPRPIITFLTFGS